MPNGRPGDHPLTDLVEHGWDLFGAEADAKIRHIYAKAPALHGIRGELTSSWPRIEGKPLGTELIDPPAFLPVPDKLLRYVDAQQKSS